MSNFKSLNTVKKGLMGESIIYPFLKAKGWGKFTPDEKENIPHICDGFMYKMKPKFEFRAFEIKTRPKMFYYDSQGLDNNKIEAYDYLLGRGIDITFFFIDEITRKIHASKYSKMKIQSTNIENGKTITYPNSDILAKQKITMFNMRTMLEIGQISLEQQKELKSLSNMNESYR